MKGRKVLLAGMACLCVSVSLLWLTRAGAQPLFVDALHWTTIGDATPGAGPGAAQQPANPMEAFGLSGLASCRTKEPPTRSPWLAVARTDAQTYHLDPLAFEWKIWQESGFNPDVPDSPTGAIGIAQFEPATAQGMGIDPRDPQQALEASARLDAGHLTHDADRARQLASHYGGWSARYGYALALAAYNAGSGALESAWNQAFSGAWPSSPWAWLSYLGQQTQHYIPDILNCPIS